MGRGGQSYAAAENLPVRASVERAELGAVRLLRAIHGSQTSDADALSALLARLGSSAAAQVSEARLQECVLEELERRWEAEAEAVGRRLLGAAVLARPKRKGLRRPRLAELVTVADWRTLAYRHDLDLLGRWGEIDWALWLNGLIRERCEVETRRPPTGGQSQGSESDTARLARTIFFSGS